MTKITNACMGMTKKQLQMYVVRRCCSCMLVKKFQVPLKMNQWLNEWYKGKLMLYVFHYKVDKSV